jgi:hypothetical protein
MLNLKILQNMVTNTAIMFHFFKPEYLTNHVLQITSWWSLYLTLFFFRWKKKTLLPGKFMVLSIMVPGLGYVGVPPVHPTILMSDSHIGCVGVLGKVVMKVHKPCICSVGCVWLQKWFNINFPSVYPASKFDKGYGIKSQLYKITLTIEHKTKQVQNRSPQIDFEHGIREFNLIEYSYLTLSHNVHGQIVNFICSLFSA